jgi:MFS family permease
MSAEAEAAAAPPADGPNRDQASVVAACLVGNFVSPTPVVQSPFGLFLVPISLAFAWPRERVSGVLSLFALMTALSYPIVGRLADRFGPRRPILAGSLGYGACVVALGFVTPNVYVFYGLFALMGVFGSMPSTMMFNRVISGWFDRARGSMLGLTAGLGNGAGATLAPIIALILMSRFGWRGGYIGLGAMVLLFGFPSLVLLLKEPPVAKWDRDSPGVALEGLTLPQAAGTQVFWMTLIAIGLGAGCLTAVLAHVVPILTDRHVPAAQATLVVSVFAMVTAGWQIVVGWLLDRTGSPKMVAPFYLVAVLGLLTLEHGASLPILVLGGAMMGIGMGAEFGALPYFISRYFGLRRFGMIAGAMYSAVIVAQGITPYLMDVDFDRHRSYLLSEHVIEVALVAGALLIAWLPRYAATAALWTSRPAAA